MHEFKRRFPAPPPDWSRPRLGDIAERVTTRNVERNANVLTISAEFGLISQNEYFSRRVASESVTGYYLIKRGDFAYNKSYSRGYPLGAIRRLDRYEKGCVSPLYICFRPRVDAVDSGFLLQYLDGGAIDAGLADVSKEGVRNHGLLNVGVADFFSLEVPLPSLAEQRVAAQVLDILDTTIRQTEAIIEKLKQVKQGLLHDLLTRGIDANGELRTPQSQAPHLYKDSPLGWIPREWDAVPVSDLAENLDGRRLPIKESERRPGIYPYYGASGIIDWVESYLLDGDYVLLGEDGENVVSRNLPLAFRVIGKVWVNNHAHIYKASQGTDVRFLVEVLEAKEYGPWVSGSAQPKLTQDALARIRFQRPPAQEQVMIAERLEAVASRIASENSEIKKLRAMKSGLMDDLLTGRVRVTPLLNNAAPA